MAGNQPIQDDLYLTRGADFVNRYEINPSDPEIGPGVTATIVITKNSKNDSPVIAEWAGSVSARYVEFDIESTETDLIPDGYSYRLLVSIPDDDDNLDHAWYYGSVSRIQ